jgi:hypothetical protein
VPPTGILALIGDSVTDATGAVELLTLRVAGVLVTPEAEAVICAVPSVCPVAMPELSMLAMSAELLVQVKVRPLMAFPLESLAVAVNVCWPPMPTEASPGVTEMVAMVWVDEEPPPQPGSRPSASSKQNKKMCPRFQDAECGGMA